MIIARLGIFNVKIAFLALFVPKKRHQWRLLNNLHIYCLKSAIFGQIDPCSIGHQWVIANLAIFVLKIAYLAITTDDVSNQGITVQKQKKFGNNHQ